MTTLEKEEEGIAAINLNDDDSNNKMKKNQTTKPTLVYSEGSTIPENAPHWAKSAHERLQMKYDKAKATGETLFGIKPPPGVKRVLLHSCCAPCSGAMVEEMNSSQELDNVTVFFYNPNIHPKREYEIRKNENKAFCEKLNIPFIDVDYDVDNWYSRTKGMEYHPERGHRCSVCFDIRMERTALYAYENGFDAIATTNSTSRWKDEKQVDESGIRCVQPYNNLQYWKYNWKSDEMTLRKVRRKRRECVCVCTCVFVGSIA